MWKIRTFAGVALVGLACCASLSASQLDEYGVKSAFVYNFLQFVDWPSPKLLPGAPLVICVVGDSPIAAALIPVAGQIVKGHAIRIRGAASRLDLAACHVAYVPETSSVPPAELAALPPGGGLLIVGEGANAISHSVIGLVLVDNRVGFEVNLDLAARQGLTISSRLLRLARRVTKGPAQGPLSPAPGTRGSASQGRER